MRPCYYILIVLKRGVCNICHTEMNENEMNKKLMKISNMTYLFSNYKFCSSNFFYIPGGSKQR